MKTTKRKINILKITSVLMLLAPILTVVGINFNSYFTVKKGFITAQAVEVSAGFILAAVSGGLLLIGKTKAFKGTRGLAVALALSILLKAVMNDLVLILTALTTGSLLYGVFKNPIKTLEQTYQYEKQAGIQAIAQKNVNRELFKELNNGNIRGGNLDGSV